MDTICVQIELEIDDPCWYYKSQDPVLTCTVYSMDWYITWKRDGLLVGIGGRMVSYYDDNRYQIISYTNNTVRQEKLRVSVEEAMSSITRRSPFHCEHHGYSSPDMYLNIPGKHGGSRPCDRTYV